MITRSKMRRQLYRGGGIAGLYPRQKYGIGSWVQDKKDKAINVFQKVVPNELADIAVKAAPFVAPFNPLAAGMMRGLGRLDQRGNLTDALKQGLATYGIGQLGQKMGTGSFQELQNPFKPEAFRNPFAGMAESLTPTKAGSTPGAEQLGTMKTTDPNQGFLNKVLYGEKGGEGFFGDQGLIGKGGGFDMKGAIGKGLPAVYVGSTLAALAIQKALGDVGGREPGESLTAFNKRRESTVANYLAYYYKRANKFRIPPEELEEKTAEFVRQNTTEYRTGENQGGRVGLKHGTGIMDIQEEDKLQTGAPPITYEGDMRPNRRMNQMGGTGPNGLPGIPRQAPDGMEFDMRQNGGFQGLGAKEGKDDVPAMLAKNEFVFTADAVRGAGDGDVEKGAQRMYDTMQKLERRVV